MSRSTAETTGGWRRTMAVGLGLAILCLLTFPLAATAQTSFSDRPLFPIKPAPSISLRIQNVEGISKTLAGVPEYIWWYGCSPTAAGMIIGWWDAQPGCEGLFEGSAATWYGSGASGTKRMVASQAHIDTGKALSLTYGSANGHAADCLADFMFTHNGSTGRGSIGIGLEDFCKWNDPTTSTNESYVATSTTLSSSGGWTYADYCKEIDAGRPVHLGLTSSKGGHSVTGVGYDNTNGKKNYICWTTWGGWGLRSWNWDMDTESGYGFQVYAATYLKVTPRSVSGNNAPTSPTTVTITPSSPVTADALTAAASGSSDADRDSITYQYQWAKSTDSGKTWSAWSNDGATLAASLSSKGEQWKTQARANDGRGGYSGWVASAVVTIGNTAPTAPTSVTITPTTPVTTSNLTAAGSGGADADGDTLTYDYQWAKSTDNGSTWSAFGNDGATLSASNLVVGQQWKARTRISDGATVSDWKESGSVTVVSTVVTLTAPTSVTVSPTEPKDADNITGIATGSVDASGAKITYQHNWTSSKDGGKTWNAWGYSGTTLQNGATTPGELWKTRARAYNGTIYSDWTESASVLIAGVTNTAPSTPTTVTVSPTTPLGGQSLSATCSGSTDAEGDALTYECQWSVSTNSGSTWSAWGYDGLTLAASNVTKGQQWKAHARARDGSLTSAWKESGVVTVGNTAPTAPTANAISPAAPKAGDSLTAAASGATDADKDTLTYAYEWARSTDSGKTWSPWGWAGSVLASANVAAGNQWKSRAQVSDGTTVSAWKESTAVTVTAAAVTLTAPTSVTVTPTAPKDADNITGVAAGSVDSGGAAVTYQHNWTYSKDNGKTWSAWGYSGSTLQNGATSAGQLWKTRARAYNGTIYSDWTESAPVLILADPDQAPTRPIAVAISPSQPTSSDMLRASGAGSADPEGKTITYQFNWTSSTDGGRTWAAWGYTGPVLQSSARGSVWKTRGRAYNGTNYSDWVESAPVTVKNSAPGKPEKLSVVPSTANTNDTLTVTAESAPDVDGDAVTYRYQWYKSTDSGATWQTGPTGPTVAAGDTTRGEYWRATVCAYDGSDAGEWAESDLIRIANAKPTNPQRVAVAAVVPTDIEARQTGAKAGSPTTLTDLQASASGATDPDGAAISYRYQWYKSADDGQTWQAGPVGRVVLARLTARGEQWKVASRATDGESVSDWAYSDPVTIGNCRPVGTKLTVTPKAPSSSDNVIAQGKDATDADGDPITYRYQWYKSTDGGSTWVNGPAGRELPATETTRGERWKVGVRAFDGRELSAWVYSPTMVIGNSRPEPPTTVVAQSAAGGGLRGDASGATDCDGDAITYRYQWYLSTDDGQTWKDGPAGRTLSADAAGKGSWRVAARANDGTAVSTWRLSQPFGTPDTAQATTSLMLTAAAAPASQGSMSIAVSLTVAAEVEVSVCNMTGRAIAVLPVQSLPAGMSTLTWNGRSASGTKVPAGAYLLRVSARNARGNQANAVTPCQVRR